MQGATLNPHGALYGHTGSFRETERSYLLDPLKIVVHNLLKGASELATRKALQALYGQVTFLLRELLSPSDPPAPMNQLYCCAKGTRFTEFRIDYLPQPWLLLQRENDWGSQVSLRQVAACWFAELLG